MTLKLTSLIEDPAKIGGIALANPAGGDLLKEVAALKGKRAILTGSLTADEKGQRTLTLSRVAEAK